MNPFMLDLFHELFMRYFNADNMKVYISALGHARKFKFSSQVHLLSINQIFQYRHAFDSVQCR